MISNQLLPQFKSSHCRRTLLSLNDISNHPKALGAGGWGLKWRLLLPPGRTWEHYRQYS